LYKKLLCLSCQFDCALPSFLHHIHASSYGTSASKELTGWLISKELSTGQEVIFMTGKQSFKRLVGSLLAIGLLSATLLAEASAASRYDMQLQNAVTQKLASKSQYSNVKASVEDGIVTLTGTVDLYQRKLDAAKLARKAPNSQGVRNLITVSGPNVPDTQLEQKLATKLTYVREGYDSTFDYFAIGVNDGVVTVEGQDRTGVGRDEALADIANMPGVKDVIDNVSIEPLSPFDDSVRLRALRAIYGDPVLSKYAIDPARPIRIIVVNGHVTLYGSVDSAMDKNVAGIRAGGVFGAFSVENKLQVAKT
jgi:hyperosmotically inducible periplasmic protein